MTILPMLKIFKGLVFKFLNVVQNRERYIITFMQLSYQHNELINCYISIYRFNYIHEETFFLGKCFPNSRKKKMSDHRCNN